MVLRCGACGCLELRNCNRSWMIPRQNVGHLQTQLRLLSMMNYAISVTQASPPTARQHSDHLCPRHDHRRRFLDIDTAPDSFRRFMTDDHHCQIGFIHPQHLMLIMWESRHGLETFHRRQEGDRCCQNTIDLHRHLTAIMKSHTQERHLVLLLHRKAIHLHITIGGMAEGDHCRVLTAAITVNTMEDVHHGLVRIAHQEETGITDKRDPKHPTRTRSMCRLASHTSDLIRCLQKRSISSHILHRGTELMPELMLIVDQQMWDHLCAPHRVQWTMTVILHTDLRQGALCYY